MFVQDSRRCRAVTLECWQHFGVERVTKKALLQLITGDIVRVTMRGDRWLGTPFEYGETHVVLTAAHADSEPVVVVALGRTYPNAHLVVSQFICLTADQCEKVTRRKR